MQLRSAHRLLIHNYVIAEFIALCTARGASRRLALAFLDGLFSDHRIEMRWVDRELHCRGVEFLRKRLDKSYSLTDAVSFILMRKSRVRIALTSDEHFEQEGFVRLLKPG
ncbi:MAG: hypothetical protein FD180_1871 [Planctomycetota bacterium]|nr:MAG: hypothetical protein FD180_1871 [Planctomycetota bacterium]